MLAVFLKIGVMTTSGQERLVYFVQYEISSLANIQPCQRQADNTAYEGIFAIICDQVGSFDMRLDPHH